MHFFIFYDMDLVFSICLFIVCGINIVLVLKCLITYETQKYKFLILNLWVIKFSRKLQKNPSVHTNGFLYVD